MSFKKMKEEVVEALEIMEITKLEAYSKELFSAIKSGRPIFATAPKNSGKTTAALVAVFNKVNQETEGSPRAVFMSSTVDEVEALGRKTYRPARRLDVTIDLAHDKGSMLQQRNDIFDGTEIIFGSPKRMCELYLQNGVNFKLLDLFIVDDLDECLAQNRAGDIKRMIESLEAKTQVILLTNAFTPRVEAFLESIDIAFFEVEADC